MKLFLKILTLVIGFSLIISLLSVFKNPDNSLLATFLVILFLFMLFLGDYILFALSNFWNKYVKKKKPAKPNFESKDFDRLLETILDKVSKKDK